MPRVVEIYFQSISLEINYMNNNMNYNMFQFISVFFCIIYMWF